MKIIVCGGRNYKDRAVVFGRLDSLHAGNKITELVQGGASGADELAAEWAKERGVKLSTFTAQWKTHGRTAGPIRNQRMIDAGASLLVYFPGGAGTADCKGRAERAGIPLLNGEVAQRGPLFVRMREALTPRQVSVRQVKAIARKHDVAMEQLMGCKGVRQTNRIIECRWACMEYLRVERKWSLTEIADFFGIDHTTVHHALGVLKARRANAAQQDVRAWRAKNNLHTVKGDAA